MKDADVEELAKSVGTLVEKILKLVLRDKDDNTDDEEKEDSDKNGSPELRAPQIIQKKYVYYYPRVNWASKPLLYFLFKYNSRNIIYADKVILLTNQ